MALTIFGMGVYFAAVATVLIPHALRCWLFSMKRGDTNMKKFLALALCLVLALAFAAGCKKQAATATEATQAPMTSAAAPAPAK
jgi:hypothetical protein